MKKCHCCKGLGRVRPSGSLRVGVCFYCRGKGYRTSDYGQDIGKEVF